jgi:hypothetical protein
MKNLINNYGTNVSLTFNVFTNLYEVYYKENLDSDLYKVTYCKTLAEAFEECNKKYLYMIIKDALTNNGISYSLYDNTFNPNDGYMASLQNCESVSDTLDIDTLVDHITRYTEKLKNKNMHLGIWLYDGKWYLDVSLKFDKLNDAVVFGRANKQIAIFDNKNKQSITL